MALGVGEEEYLLREKSILYGAQLKPSMISDDHLRSSQEATSFSYFKTSEISVDKNRKQSTDLFHYASSCDKLLMIFGSFSALTHGVCWALFAFSFGEMCNNLMNVHNSIANNSLSLNQTANSESNNFQTGNFNSFADQMEKTGLFLFGLGVVILLSSYLQTLCWQLSRDHQIYLLHQDFLYRILRQDRNWFSQYKKKDTINELLEDIDFIRRGIGLNLSFMIQYSSTFLSALILGLYTQWKLMMISFLLMFVIFLFLMLLWKYLESSTRKESIQLDQSKKHVKNSLDCITNVLSLMGQQREINKYENIFREMNKWTVIKCVLRGLTLSLVVFGFYSLYILFASSNFLLNLLEIDIDVGDVVVVLFCVMATSFTISYWVPCLKFFLDAKRANTHLFSEIDTIPTIDPYSTKQKNMSNIKGKVSLFQVSFSLYQRGKLDTIQRASIKFHSGQMTAVVGSSHCGKNLLKDLLLRFYDPIEGQIFIDDYELKTINVHCIRESVRVIEEDPVFLSDLVIENIVAGLEHVSLDNVVAAAKKIHVHDCILSLPQGYATSVEENQLPVVIKQMIAMVRVMLQNPKVVIVEECQQTTKQLQLALDTIRAERTLIILATRVSTLKKCDRVIVLQNGWVVADGTYNHLKKTRDEDNVLNNLVQEDSLIDDTEQEAKQNDNNQIQQLITKRRTKVTTDANKLQLCHTNKFKYTSKLILTRPIDVIILIFGSLFAFIFGLCPSFAAYKMSDIFLVYGTPQTSESRQILLRFCVLAFIAAISHAFQTISLRVLGEKILIRLRVNAYSHIFQQPLSWFEEDENQPELIAQTLTDTSLASMFENCVGICVSVLAESLVKNLKNNWQLHSSKSSQFILEAVLDSWTIQSQLLERKIVEAFAEQLTEPYLQFKQKTITTFCIRPFFIKCHILFCLRCTLFFSIIYNSTSTFQSRSNFGLTNFAFFFLNFVIFISSAFFLIAISMTFLMRSASQFHTWQQTSEQFSRLFHFIDLHSNVSQYDQAFEPDIKGELVFKQVFYYRQDKCILRNFSFTVKPNQLIALVGDAEAGRIILRMVNRLLEPSLGQVILDHVQLSQYSLNHLRKYINVICYPFLLPGTLRENIVYATDEDHSSNVLFNSAIQLSDIDQFVWDLPQGWNTTFTNGTKLPIRDQIRIAFARSYLRNAKILLVDDIFDSLTHEETRAVLSSLHKIRKEKTCLVVTTKPAILQVADVILVFHSGTLLEQGSHQQLMEKRGTYYRTYHS